MGSEGRLWAALAKVLARDAAKDVQRAPEHEPTAKSGADSRATDDKNQAGSRGASQAR